MQTLQNVSYDIYLHEAVALTGGMGFLSYGLVWLIYAGFAQ
jgi:hypothetical protein